MEKSRQSGPQGVPDPPRDAPGSPGAPPRRPRGSGYSKSGSRVHFWVPIFGPLFGPGVTFGRSGAFFSSFGEVLGPGRGPEAKKHRFRDPPELAGA